MKKYPITFWYGIRPEFLSRERLVEAMECGFNLIECGYGREDNLKVLRWCDELGLKANVRDSRVDDALAEKDGWQEGLLEMLRDYSGFSSLNRFFIRDEPSGDYFKTLGRVADFLHEHSPEHGEYINLLPYNAFVPADGSDPYETYLSHVRGFCDTVHPTILSYDNYNMRFEEVESREMLSGRREAYISDENRRRNGWENKIFAEIEHPYYFNNLEIIRSEARERGIPWMDIILLVEHWHYRNPGEAEVRFEAFCALAYGSEALSYFTYWTPGSDNTEPWSYHNGIINVDGTRGEKYEVIKRINGELSAMYRGLTLPLPDEKNVPTEMLSKEVFHVGYERDRLVREYKGYGKTEKISGGDFIAGFFAGERMIIVNKDFHSASDCVIETSAGSELYRLNKKSGVWEKSDAHIRISAGDGELFAVK